MDRNPNLLTPQEAAGYVGLWSKNSAASLCRYCRLGLLLATHVGRYVYYMKAELDAFLERLTAQAAGEHGPELARQRDARRAARR